MAAESINQPFKALFFGPFRVVTKAKEIEYALKSDLPLVRDLLKEIVSQFPKLQEYIYEGDDLSDNTSIIINGEDIKGGDGIQTVISPDDRITFFKAAGGG